MSIIDSSDFHFVVKKMREFFTARGFIEVHTQNRLSILAACEDPDTIATYEYSNQVWPLPQTGQMWLEYEMLKHPDRAPGYFCVSTSYRQEPNPIEGRHEVIFHMFEFEIKGGMDDLLKMEKDLASLCLVVKTSAWITRLYAALALLALGLSFLAIQALSRRHIDIVKSVK